MKLSLLSFLVLALILSCLFLLASFDAGFGYVFVQWRGWQLQSNLFFILLMYFALALLLLGLSYAIAQYLRPKLSKYRVAKSFAQLHPYERMGIMWLLQGQQRIPDVILQHYQASTLLYPLVQAKLFTQQRQFEQAQHILQQYSYNLFELSEVLQIEIAKQQHDYGTMRERLAFLQVQPLSAWLQPLSDVYQEKIQQLQADYAIACAWQAVDFHTMQQLNDTQRQQWFMALWQNQYTATDAEKQHFIAELQLAQTHLAEIQTWQLNSQHRLLKICHLFTELDTLSLALAESILAQSFIPDTVYIWIEQALKKLATLSGTPRQHYLQQMQQCLNGWQQFAHTQPSFAFAQYYIDVQNGKVLDSHTLLMRFPQNPYMIYLHLQQQLNTQPQLQPYVLQLLKQTTSV